MRKLLHMLATLAAGVWVGGMVLIGPIIAKNTFEIMREKIDVAYPNAAAGRIMAVNFQQFDTVQLACAGVLLVCLAISAVLARQKFGPITRLLMALVATGMLIYSVQFLTPKIASMQKDVATAADESAVRKSFDEFHESAVRVAKINLSLLVLVTLSLGWSGPPKPFDPEQEPVMPATPASIP